MLITSLSYISNATFIPVKKIYSVNHIGDSGFYITRNGSASLDRAGEIRLTKACDHSLENQAKKLGANAVLATNYSIAFDVHETTYSPTKHTATMYAYGEAVKLKKF